jgi:hypothetical protein
MDESTAYWDGNTLMVHWHGSKTPDEAGYFSESRNVFEYDGYEDTYRIKTGEGGKPDARTMLYLMQEHQRGI